MNNDASQRADERLVPFVRPHKVSGLNWVAMFASGRGCVYAATCMPLDEWLSARLASVMFAHREER